MYVSYTPTYICIYIHTILYYIFTWQLVSRRMLLSLVKQARARAILLIVYKLVYRIYLPTSVQGAFSRFEGKTILVATAIRIHTFNFNSSGEHLATERAPSVTNFSLTLIMSAMYIVFYN